MSGVTFVDQGIAASLPSGSVAGLGYGNKIVSQILTIGVTTIGTVSLPYFSKMAVDLNWKLIRTTLIKFFSWIFIASILIFVFFVCLSYTITKFLFVKDAFTITDAQIVANIQIAYTLQIPFYIASVLLARVVSSIQHNHILLAASAINLVVCIICDIFFTKWWGVIGLPVSNSVVYLGSFIFLWIAVWRGRNLKQW
jgi:putative peptidoglycan lipid II flippase